jgi:hypothetical protein
VFGDQIFRKSSYSGAGNNCVEVADCASRTFVRDSQQPELGHLPFASADWSVFVSSLKKAGA